MCSPDPESICAAILSKLKRVLIMFIIKVTDQHGVTLHSKNVGSWRDHAAELYGQVVRAAKKTHTVTLEDSFNNEIIYEKKGERS